jgi:hypothetical protein
MRRSNLRFIMLMLFALLVFRASNDALGGTAYGERASTEGRLAEALSAAGLIVERRADISGGEAVIFEYECRAGAFGRIAVIAPEEMRQFLRTQEGKRVSFRHLHWAGNDADVIRARISMQTCSLRSLVSGGPRCSSYLIATSESEICSRVPLDFVKRSILVR